ncbi:MAG: HupE/UreJ family protein [Candidatus Sericytochromatia bacterium]|nr:HupE/UreJ family protein [Candidatus Sericytochromatia bacterium]
MRAPVEDPDWRLARWVTIVLGVLVLWVGGAGPAQAHWADLAVADIAVQATEATCVLTVPTGLVATADDDHDGQLSAAEIALHRTELTGLLGASVAIMAAGQASTVTLALTSPVAAPAGAVAGMGRHTTLRLDYRWLRPSSDVTIRYALFVPGVSTARCLATISHGETVQSFAFGPQTPEFTLSRPQAWRQIANFSRLGIEHLLTGYDHLLFLISLLVVGGGIAYSLKMVTAFTVAHSLTLGLAVLDVLVLPPRLVECAIALTIVYVAAENLWRKSFQGRFAVVLGFGLIHGLGFAAVLRDLHLPPGQLAVSLLGFNLGIECGQLAVVLVAWVVLAAFRRRAWDGLVRVWVSVAVILAGLLWFVERAWFTA